MYMLGDARHSPIAAEVEEADMGAREEGQQQQHSDEFHAHRGDRSALVNLTNAGRLGLGRPVNRAAFPGAASGRRAPPLSLMRTGAPGYDNAAWLCARSPLLCVRTALLCALNGLFFRASFFFDKKTAQI